MHPLLFDITQIEPVWADLNGGMDRLPDLAEVTTKIRTNLALTGDLRRAVAIDSSADFKIINGVDAERIHQKVPIAPRANFKFDFPPLESVESLEKLNAIQGMIDLDKVMVITGFAEVGPWGSSRTRWEMEAKGEFTIEGLIEMSWIMGLIKHFDGRLKSGKAYVGWVDSKTEEPVDDKDVRAKYEKDILEHAGIRLIGESCLPAPPFSPSTLPTSLRADFFSSSFRVLPSQSRSSSTVTTPRRRPSTRRSSSTTTSSPSRSPPPTPSSSSVSRETSVTSGPSPLESSSSNSSEEPGSSSPSRLSSPDSWPDSSPPDGTPVDTVFPTTSSLRLTGERSFSCHLEEKPRGET